MSFTGLLISTATLSRPTFAQAATGSETRVYTAIGTRSCRVAPLGGQERVAAGRRAAIATHRVFLAADAGVVETDRLVIGGVTHEVLDVAVRNGAAGPHHLEALTEVIE